MPINRMLVVVLAKMLAKCRRLENLWQQQKNIDQQVRTLRQAGTDPAIDCKVIVITGSSRGIGLTLAQALFQRGARIVINGRDQAVIDEALKWFESRDGTRIAGIRGDIAIEADAEHLIAAAVSRFGQLDILINAAGITGPLHQRAWEITAPEWRQTLAVNLDGAFNCSKHFMRWLIEHNTSGRIIHVSSGAAIMGTPHLAPYATSKAALESLVRNLAADADGTGITICGIELGSTQTSMTRKFLPLESYLQLPLPESHIPVFLHAATADCGLLHGRILASWRFNDKPESESWLASSIVYGGRLEFKPRQVPDHLTKDQTEFMELAENQYGASPAVTQFLAKDAASFPITQYPDLNYTTLREALAARMELSPNQFALGNGSSELVERLLRIFVHCGESVVSNDPSWFIFDRMCGMYGINNLKAPFAPSTSQRLNHNLSGILKRLQADTRLIYLVHPSNPVGTPILHDEFSEFISHVPAHIPVIVDEAYFEYSEDLDGILNTLEFVKHHPHPIIGLRTFSKIYGLAGMRVGYAYSSAEMIKLLGKLELTFNVSAIAAECARIALSDQEYVEMSRTNTLIEKRRIEKFLKGSNLDYIPTQSSLMLVQSPMANPDNFYQRLRNSGVLLAPLKQYDKYFMWPIGLPRQNDKIMHTITSMMKPLTRNAPSVPSA